jgi:hypothetical protein
VTETQTTERNDMSKSRSKQLTDRFVGGYATVSAKVGTYVEIEGGPTCGKCLLPCDDWAEADFRWEDPIYGASRAIACNVHVTGRTIQRRFGCQVIRGQIEWVGDGEPNTFSKCWIDYGTATVEYAEEKVA